MGGRIDLRDYSDPSEPSVGDDLSDLFRGNESSDAAVLAELGDGRHLHGEGVLVDDVPVQHVELGVHHRVKGTLYSVDWLEVP